MTSSSTPHLTILGSGPCGLYGAHTALDLGATVTLWEKEAQPGGLAAGHQRGGNWYDLGVHMLHAFDQDVYKTCAEAMGGERIEVPLKSHIKWGGKLYHYPLRGRDILAGIPPLTLVRCLTGLLIAEMESHWGKRTPGPDAESALCELYGPALYEFFFEEFTHRYWGIHPRELSAEFVRRKMPRLSAVDVFKNILEKLHLTSPRDATEGALRFETLHYSTTGTETLPRKLAESIQQRGAQIHLSSAVETIHHDGKTITGIGEHPTESSANQSYLSTIPLPHLIEALSPAAPDHILEAAKHLRFKPMTVYALLVNKPRCMDALYTYYRDRSFHRVGEPKNAGLLVTPADHTTLIVETTCETGDSKWNGEALPDILNDLEAEGLCTAEQVVEHHLLHAAQAYPVFTKGFEPHLETVLDYLSRFTNLRTAGRQGAFTYPNMHSAMRMGADAVTSLLSPELR